MKVFVSTLYKRNYGSALQAFALQNKLKELGVDPIIIQKPSENERIKISLNNRIKRFFRPEKHYGIGKKFKRFLQRDKIQNRNKKIDMFIDKYVRTENLEVCKSQMNDGKFIFLAGSDQVWSALNHSIESHFLFDYGIKGDKFSYAASTGISDFTTEQLDYYKRVLNDFKILSFRETVISQTMKQVFPNKMVRSDLDPTLLYDSGFWNNYTSERLVNESYILVYMLRPNKDLIKMAKKIAKQENPKIVYMGLYINHYPGIFTVESAGVEDFLSYIRFADKVITNSFHGTVFSILFEKQFVSVYVESTSERAKNLLHITNLEERLIYSVSEIGIINQSINYINVRKILNDYREESIKYLMDIVNR